MVAESKHADVPVTFDAVLSELSLRHPGFKGVVGSPDGRRTVVLTSAPVADVPALLGDLAATLGTDPSRLSVPALAPTAGRPDFHRLYEIKVGLRRLLFESNLVHWLDLDETVGRITLGTASLADEDLVRASMTPEELAAVDFIRAEPAVDLVKRSDLPRALVASARPSAASARTLRSLRDDAFDPLIAGAETELINFDRGGAAAGTSCTQGPVVVLDGVWYGFLTNAHCTLDRTGVQDTPFYQPFPAEENQIGSEFREVIYRSRWFVNDGYFSDVAFVRTADGQRLRGQMTSADNCTPASCVENGIITDVVGTSSYLTVNVRVFKTGEATGTTAGKVTNTCLDLRGGDGDMNLCQNAVSYDSSIPSPLSLAKGGDSGAAVMVNGGVPGSTSATIAGILWAGTESERVFYYSPWENIQSSQKGGEYGLNVQVVRAAQGVVTNSPGSTGGSGGGAPPGGCDPRAIDC